MLTHTHTHTHTYSHTHTHTHTQTHTHACTHVGCGPDACVTLEDADHAETNTARGLWRE